MMQAWYRASSEGGNGMDLGYVLRRAWEITCQHKALWLFGFLVSLGTVGARVGIGSGGSRGGRIGREYPPEVQRAVSGFLSSPYFIVAVVALVLLAVAIGVGLTVLGALGRAALVDQVQAAEDRGGVSLRAGWQAGGRHLWAVFLIRLLLGLPAAGVTLTGVLPAMAMLFWVAGQERPEVVIPGVFALPVALLTCVFPAICLAVMLSVPLSVLWRLAVRACVLEGYGVRQSIARAWAMLREHLGSVALVWLILLGVEVGVTIVIGLPLALVAMLLGTVALLMVLVSPLLPLALVLIGGLLTWQVGAAFSGVVETFTSAVWTLAYRELTGMGLTGEETASAESKAT
jgi:hypothetical protein